MQDAAPRRASRRASTFHLVFLTYSVVCSGAYGLEQIVSESGPGLALALLVTLPFLWGIPISLACAELSAFYPIEGGYYRWVRAAFGDFVGYQAGWLVWLANLMTNAAFAVLFASYLRYFLPDLGTGGHYAVALLLIWGTTLLNSFGIRLVGTTSVILTCLIFLPFLGLSVLGLMQWSHAPFTPFVHPDKSTAAALTDGLMIALWLYGGYEKLTPNAEEVENPSRAFPIALGIAMPMVIGSYVIPTFAGLVACDNWRDWGEAHFTVLAGQVGGVPLAAAMSIGGLLSNTCILMVTILGQSRLPMVMAQDRLFPRFFGRVNLRYGTPTLSLVAGGLALSLLACLPFAALAGLFSLVQVLAYVLICAALLRLRRMARLGHPAGLAPAAAGASGAATPSHRPFRVPLGGTGLLLLMLPVFLLTAFVVARQLWPGGGLSLRMVATDLLVFASGPVTYLLFGWHARRGGPGVHPPGL
jgi:amino acid transporter